MKRLKWLYPGMHFKRWLFLVAVGILLISAGLIILIGFDTLSIIENEVVGFLYLLTGKFNPLLNKLIAILIILAGLMCVGLAIKKMMHAVYDVVLPKQNRELVDLFYQKRYLKKGPKIVAIGGGTGLSTLLRGIKKYTNNITGLVTVADDGGSSGILRDEMGILPPGDIRNCLAALADTEPLMEDLFQYRFAEGEGLEGHSFGNLFIAAMTNISGDFEHAVKKSSEVLAIRGRVLPVTLEDMSLSARLKSGRTVEGETQISNIEGGIEEVFIDPEDSNPLPEALEVIAEADAIILGPGSLYTSVLPNLLVKDLAEAIKEADALKMYACNVMTQPGETDGYQASDHVKAIYEHVGEQIMDYILVNNEEVSAELVEKYAEEGAAPVEVDFTALKKLGLEIIEEPMINQSDLVRHDADKLAKVIMNLIFAELEY